MELRRVEEEAESKLMGGRAFSQHTHTSYKHAHKNTRGRLSLESWLTEMNTHAHRVSLAGQ